jgi:hypothetical protein
MIGETLGHYRVGGQLGSSGRDEVCVQAFSQRSGSANLQSGGKWQISKGGGMGPPWRRDGKELYYMAADGKVMAVAVTADSSFHPGEPKPLFRATPYYPSLSYILNMGPWEIAPDGSRFLLPTLAGESSSFAVVLNWTSLKK